MVRQANSNRSTTDFNRNLTNSEGSNGVLKSFYCSLNLIRLKESDISENSWLTPTICILIVLTLKFISCVFVFTIKKFVMKNIAFQEVDFLKDICTSFLLNSLFYIICLIVTVLFFSKVFSLRFAPYLFCLVVGIATYALFALFILPFFKFLQVISFIIPFCSSFYLQSSLGPILEAKRNEELAINESDVAAFEGGQDPNGGESRTREHFIFFIIVYAVSVLNVLIFLQ